jgi:hypothetical protein
LLQQIINHEIQIIRFVGWFRRGGHFCNATFKQKYVED